MEEDRVYGIERSYNEVYRGGEQTPVRKVNWGDDPPFPIVNPTPYNPVT